MAIWATNMSLGIQTMGKMIGRDLTEDEVEPVNWAMAQFAEQMSAVDLGVALAAINEYRRQMQQWWADGWDLLLTPTLSEPPVRIGEHDASPNDPMAGMKRAREFVSFTPAVQYERAAGDQPAAACLSRRSAHRGAARCRLRT